MKVTVFLSMLAAFVSSCFGYPKFQERIPNGKMIPNPCSSDDTWQGVGHANPLGGGARNPFGIDFYKNGKIWDECLCQLDSDGDGKTNGEELGDPDCEWSMFMTPTMTSGLSHPGVCEPMDSPTCLNKNRDLGDFCGKIKSCIEDVKTQDDVKSLRIALPESPVPAKKTSYVCQVFALPEDKDYHIIAAEPYIVNTQVIHHILLFGCQDNAVLTDNPAECGMSEAACREVIMGWTVGVHGNCLDEAFGFRIGPTGYKKILMQVHWNNPERRRDYSDSSGMVLYYTPNLRAHDGGLLATGQTRLAIPPGEDDYSIQGICSSGCTKTLPHPIYIAESQIHMHYLGSKGYIELYRNGTKVTDLVSQDMYSYDTSVTFINEDPVVVLPCDYIKTFCHYKSTDRTETTYYGEATTDEMCIGALTYYPKIEDLRDCMALGNIPTCNGELLDYPDVGACNFTVFDEVDLIFYGAVYEHCDATGVTCLPACQALLSEWSAREPCLRGEPLDVLKGLIRQYAPNEAEGIINMMESCDQKDNRTTKDKTGHHCPKNDWNIYDKVGSASTTTPTLVIVCMALIWAISGRL